MISVSILIPVYNVAPYIERCARSLFEQTYSDLEIIFVDDCSPDDSVAILERIVSEYPGRRVRIIRHERNRGLAAARNTAVANAEGKFITHVDSDDWLEPNAVELLMKRQRETGADIVSCNAFAHFADKTELLLEPVYPDKESMIRSVIQMNLDHVIWRRLILRTLYTDNGISAFEGTDIGEDHYTLPRLVFYAGSFAVVDAPLYHYNCFNAGSYMRSTSSSFSIRRYFSDCGSCLILYDFFERMDKRYCDQLKKILEKYRLYCRLSAARSSDLEAYKIISKDLGLLSFDYPFVRLYVLVRRLLHDLAYRYLA